MSSLVKSKLAQRSPHHKLSDWNERRARGPPSGALRELMKPACLFVVAANSPICAACRHVPANPCATDVNADGHVNGQDIDVFVAALFAW